MPTSQSQLASIVESDRVLNEENFYFAKGRSQDSCLLKGIEGCMHSHGGMPSKVQ